MALVDLPLEELRTYRYRRQPPPDLRAFWDRTVEEARTAATAPVISPAEDSLLTAFEPLDLTFSGFAGDPIRAWWLRPRQGGDVPVPAVVEFLGYGGGRGRAHERMVWAGHGYHHIVVDTRGQGSQYNPGVTPDPHGSGPAHPGYLTRGVDHPDNLYYRRVVTDAVRAVDTVRTLPGVDEARIAVCGHSQGGALALAAAALSDHVVACGARTPFLCGIDRSIDITDRGPYAELRQYLAVHRSAAALDVLAYVDCALLAQWISCPVWTSVALMDPVCPPSGIFGALNNLARPADVVVWPYNAHEGGMAEDEVLLASWFAQHFAS